MKKSNHPFFLMVVILGAGLCTTFMPGSTTLLAKDKKPKKSKTADYALIKGSVFRGDGFSLRGARVTCRRAADSKPKWETFSGENGEFAFRVPVGKMQYIVTAEWSGAEPASKTVEITNNERQDIAIILKSKTP